MIGLLEGPRADGVPELPIGPTGHEVDLLQEALTAAFQAGIKDEHGDAVAPRSEGQSREGEA